MERFLIHNSMQCLNCNDIIISKSRHNYVICSCGGCSTDGGNDYIHRGWMDGIDFVTLDLYSTDPHWAIRPYISRSGFGAKGQKDYGTFRVTKLPDMSDNYILNTIAWLRQYGPENVINIFKNEIEYRKQNNIKINE
jgi:hypothetical protein